MVLFFPHPLAKQIVALCQTFGIDPQLGVVLQVGDAVSSPDLATVKGHFEQLWGWSQQVIKSYGNYIDYPKSPPLGGLRRHFFLAAGGTGTEPKSGVETRSLHYEGPRYEGLQFGLQSIWHGWKIVFEMTRQPDGSEKASIQLSLGSNWASVSVGQSSWREETSSRQGFKLGVEIFDTDVLRDSLGPLSYPLQGIQPTLDLMAAVAWLVYQDDPIAFAEGFSVAESHYWDDGSNSFTYYHLAFDQDGTPHFFDGAKSGLEIDLAQFKPTGYFSSLSSAQIGSLTTILYSVFCIDKYHRNGPWAIRYHRPVQQGTSDDRFSRFVRRLLPKLEGIGESAVLKAAADAARVSD